MDNGWEAVRDGDIYCAPKCGGKCKWDDYTHACDEAATLAAVMKEATGLEWDTRVHENLGWHYSVYLTAFKFDLVGPMVRVVPCIHHTLEERWILTGYNCFFNGPGKQIVVRDDDPVVSFEAARYQMDEFLINMNQFIVKTYNPKVQ